ncbi:crotonobetainyl-CoA:carnitine CoA-transferase CaiB-like acyl-CoA transferase [Bradyrhizobium sp. GM5.1]
MPTKPQLPERSSRATGAPTALDGLLVVDFTRVVAGPACTQTLADFGAHVIKIENPDGGDDTRAYEHAEIGGESAAYLSLNRNKRGITLDLTVPEAREIALDLIRQADVVVENFSSGVMKKFGLDYETVAPLNPRLVYCSISAYGRTGPFASRPGFDPITQAESGFMSLNGFADGPAVRTGPPIVDMATGMSACNAILMALLARDRLGRGQHVEVALFDVAMGMTGFYGMAYLINGENPGRFGNSPSGSPTVGVYEASDGPLYMACANDRLYRRLVVEVLNRPDLITDPQFATRKARSEHKRAFASSHRGGLCERYSRELDDQDEAGQYSGRLSPNGRGGVQCTGGARAPSLEPDSASYGGVGPEHRAADCHELDRPG